MKGHSGPTPGTGPLGSTCHSGRTRPSGQKVRVLRGAPSLPPLPPTKPGLNEGSPNGCFFGISGLEQNAN